MSWLTGSDGSVRNENVFSQCLRLPLSLSPNFPSRVVRHPRHPSTCPKPGPILAPCVRDNSETALRQTTGKADAPQVGNSATPSRRPAKVPGRKWPCAMLTLDGKVARDRPAGPTLLEVLCPRK